MLPPPLQGSLPAGWLAFTARELNPLDRDEGFQITSSSCLPGLFPGATSEKLREVLPIFDQAANLIADPQVRNRGTIGGSLANADRAADWPAVVIALKAELEIAGPKGRRRVAATDFFVDIFTTAREAGEVLAAIHIARPEPGMRFTYRKIRHPASGYAVVGVAAGLRLKDGVVAEISIGVTGAAGRAFAADAATEFLSGQTASPGKF